MIAIMRRLFFFKSSNVFIVVVIKVAKLNALRSRLLQFEINQQLIHETSCFNGFVPARKEALDEIVLKGMRRDRWCRVGARRTCDIRFIYRSQVWICKNLGDYNFQILIVLVLRETFDATRALRLQRMTV